MCCDSCATFWGAFAKRLRKTTGSLATSVHMDSQWTDCLEILCRVVLLNYIDQMHVWLKLTRNSRPFVRKPVYLCEISPFRRKYSNLIRRHTKYDLHAAQVGERCKRSFNSIYCFIVDYSYVMWRHLDERLVWCDGIIERNHRFVMSRSYEVTDFFFARYTLCIMKENKNVQS